MGDSIGGALRRTAVAQRVKARALAFWRHDAISRSPYFDPAWYRENNADIKSAGIDPLHHFLEHGEGEDRSPGPVFDSAAYVSLHPDARGAALTHFHRTLHKQKVGALRLAAIESKWFDEAWYREAHAAVDGADFETEHPLAHYDRTGFDPSPVFDQADYLSQLIAASVDQHPLDHWIAANDGRISSSIRPRVVASTRTTGPGQPLVQHRVRARSELADMDIAVMIHAHYLDVLPSLLGRLSLLPAIPTLLVSVSTVADAAGAHRMIDNMLGAGQPRVVKLAPNRGRNFAPLLCSFADEIRDHEYVLHLHTKKSLYSGQERSDWRSHLVTSLLPSTSGVDAILSLLADDPTVGVVQAPIWGPISNYAHYWFGNGIIGTKLYERLGVKDRRASGYVVYPVGGMFWAKAAALQPLLDLGLTVGDFEREHGQTDHTLAHAIERTIPAAASVAGLDTVEFDAPAAQWRRNWSPRHHPEFGPNDVAPLHTALESSELVTVSLFGTLVLHTTNDADQLLGSRLGAEERVELSHEQRVATPRTWLIDELLKDRARAAQRGRSRRYVLMTDTSQSLTYVGNLLARVGASDLFDDLYVSSDCQARKDTGPMWDLVRTSEAIEPGRWLHIGDNEVADVERAIERGIMPFHISRTGDDTSNVSGRDERPSGPDNPPAGDADADVS
jgi:hypothetical protein